MQEELENVRKRRDRGGVRFMLGIVVALLVLGAGIGILLLQPAPVRFAGWTFIGPVNQQNIVLANASLQVPGRQPNTKLRFKTRSQTFGPQWKPTAKLQVLSPKVYHYGFFTLIRQ